MVWSDVAKKTNNNAKRLRPAHRKYGEPPTTDELSAEALSYLLKQLQAVQRRMKRSLEAAIAFCDASNARMEQLERWMSGGHDDSRSDSGGIGLDRQIKKQTGIGKLKGKISFDIDPEKRSSGSGGQERSLLKDVRRGRSNAANVRTAKLVRLKKADRQLDRNLGRLKDRLSLRRPFEEIDPIEVTRLAKKMFGSAQKAHVWLNRPNRALSGRTPLSLMSDQAGVDRVRVLLGRIEHGVFS